MKKYKFGLILLVSFLTSCTNSLEEITAENPETFDGIESYPSYETARTETYPLDWENIDFMPTPPGLGAVRVPWGGSYQFSLDIANDYRTQNGWILLYNTFNNSQMEDKWYFVLYNKYSGLIRMYYYVPSTANHISSANITHTLITDGSYASNSPLMNFAGQNVIDVNVNVRTASAIERFQFAPGNWYLVQHELAYDNQMSNQNNSSFGFKWPIKANQITSVKMNGVGQGTIKGRIDVPGVDLTISPNISTYKAATLNVNGGSDASQLSGLPQLFIAGVQNALQKGLTGYVEGIIGGILGKNSSTQANNANLKLDFNLKMEGSLVQNFLMDSRSFAIPGYDQSQTNFPPADNSPLGVFYISNRPTIIETVYITPQTNEYGQQILPKKQYVYEPDLNSFQFIFNPAVTSIASIQNIKREIVVWDQDMVQGKKENIGGRYFYTGPTVGREDYSASIVGLRIIFDVVPNDGSPKTTIAKTFVSNKTTFEIINEGEGW